MHECRGRNRNERQIRHAMRSGRSADPRAEREDRHAGSVVRQPKLNVRQPVINVRQPVINVRQRIINVRRPKFSVSAGRNQ